MPTEASPACVGRRADKVMAELNAARDESAARDAQQKALAEVNAAQAAAQQQLIGQMI